MFEKIDNAIKYVSEGYEGIFGHLAWVTGFTVIAYLARPVRLLAIIGVSIYVGAKFF